MLIELKGLVIRTADFTESDKILTLLTAEQGKITVSAKGVRSIKSRIRAATELYAYGSYVLYQKGDYFWLRESELIENFFSLRTDLDKMALAAYICEVVDDVSVENMAEGDLLKLTLNSLYILSKGTKPLPQVKGAFEMRLAALLGFTPNLSGCAVCGCGCADVFYLEMMDGRILCPRCREKANVPTDPRALPVDAFSKATSVCVVTPGALAALRYTLHCPPERLFAFALEPDELAVFADAAEDFLLNQLERSFKTLEFYKTIL